jgi:GNAT superfamily N-acetyltransferase
MLIREATTADMDVVIALRLAFVADVHRRHELSDDFAADTRAYMLEEHASRGARSWLAEDDGDAVGVVTLLLRTVPPHPTNRRVAEGYVINMYVAPAHRGAGVAPRLFDALLAAANEMDLRRITLHATDAGRPLYERTGFAAEPTWLQLDRT